MLAGSLHEPQETVDSEKTESVRLLKVHNVEHCVLEVVAEEVGLF
uniref:Uncharacterized protein n=1 Tax=Anguilla anguilla TaxID=7936 RepID=A0A0E9QMK9_ANGAN